MGLARIVKKLDDLSGMVGRQYRHLKTGNVYTVSGVSFHTEDEEPLVQYSSDGRVTWSRPAEMFLDGRFEDLGVSGPMLRPGDEVYLSIEPDIPMLVIQAPDESVRSTMVLYLDANYHPRQEFFPSKALVKKTR